MEDPAKINEIVETMRSSSAARGRSYSGTGVEPSWLVSELVEHCKTQGWKCSLHELTGEDAWLILSDNVAVLVEGGNASFGVKVADLTPVMIKTVLTAGGLLALTGAVVIAAPLAGLAVWRAKFRTGKVESLVRFADERVRGGADRVPIAPVKASISDRLGELERLRDRELITSEEFEAKRQELLREL